MKIGEIWLANLDPTIGTEKKKTRPVVVVNAGHKKNLRLAIVMPVISYKQQWEKNPFLVVLDPSKQSGLSKKSNVDCFQIRCLSHRRFVKKYGTVPAPEFDRIKTALALILDIEEQNL